MSNTLKPGDRVRRTHYGFEGTEVGGEYTVSRAEGMAVMLEGKGEEVYFSDYFELVVPATPEFQVGDRVRATADAGDDFAEFTVTTTWRDGSLSSDLNLFDRDRWDFELLSRPKPPLPTKLGSVIRITEFGGYPENYIGLLTNGGWMLHPDDKPYKSVSVFESSQPVFEVIYEPDN